MLAVAGAFPLTSDQPPLALVDPAMLAAGMAGWQRSTAAAHAGAQRIDSRAITPPGSETPVPQRIGPAPDPFAMVGPRPAFEANVLDAERDFAFILARIELARSQEEMRRGSGEPGRPAPGQADPRSPGEDRALRVHPAQSEAEPARTEPAWADPGPAPQAEDNGRRAELAPLPEAADDAGTAPSLAAEQQIPEAAE